MTVVEGIAKTKKFKRTRKLFRGLIHSLARCLKIKDDSKPHWNGPSYWKYHMRTPMLVWTSLNVLWEWWNIFSIYFSSHWAPVQPRIFCEAPSPSNFRSQRVFRWSMLDVDPGPENREYVKEALTLTCRNSGHVNLRSNGILYLVEQEMGISPSDFGKGLKGPSDFGVCRIRGLFKNLNATVDILSESMTTTMVLRVSLELS